MDIEGAEAMALKGMVKLIERDQPLFIMELTDFYLRQLGSSAESVLNFFRELNYRIFLAGEEIQEIDSPTQIKEYQHDILCIPCKKFMEYNWVMN